MAGAQLKGPIERILIGLPLVEDDAGVLEALAAIVGQRRSELEKLSSPDAARRQTSILRRMRHLFGLEGE
ncbi:hypothetical protein H6G65_09560 [Microcystis elabens FACHB-917]|nr:hypothetical protein [Microcystis elabens FACHB-917]